MGAEHAGMLARPHLHEFLSAAYRRYDIVIWSATSMKWVRLKMQELGCLEHEGYKLVALFDAGAMITVQAEHYGVLDVKPLGERLDIWFGTHSCAPTLFRKV